jgi:hypothetical protein
LVEPYIGTKKYTCEKSDVDDNGNITYSYLLTGPTELYISEDVATPSTKYYSSVPIKLHPFDIISFVDNVKPDAAEGIFAVPPAPISNVDKLFGTRYVCAMQMRYAYDNQGERSFNNLLKTGKSGLEIALLFTGAGVVSSLRNARYLAALTEFAFATGAAAELVIQSNTTNVTVKNALASYSKIANYVGFGGIIAQITKRAVLKVAREVEISLKVQGETFSGLSQAEAERFRSIFAKLEADYPSLSPSDKAIVDVLRPTDLYLAQRGIKNWGRIFLHNPTSGVLISISAKQGTFLVGSYPPDLKFIIEELNYPKIQTVDFTFPVPSGQRFNLLNITDEAYNYWAANGGFFTKVNGPWIDAAVTQGADIIVVSKIETLYNSPGVLSGFGKEIHRLEWKHGYRFDPSTKMMVSPSKANGLPTKTLQSEYTHN